MHVGPALLEFDCFLLQNLAVALQNRMSEVLHVDIHPGAKIGRGMLIDHATGVVRPSVHNPLFSGVDDGLRSDQLGARTITGALHPSMRWCTAMACCP